MEERTNLLWETVIGSQMWNVSHKGSDLDLFQCYEGDPRMFLKGKTRKYVKGGFTREPGVDRVSYELGHVIRQLVKGNVNFLCGVLGSIVTHTSRVHSELVDITLENLSKVTYHSVRGLAMGQTVWKTGVTDWGKRYDMAARIVQFGTTLLEDGVVEFKKVKIYPDTELFDAMVERLDEAYKHSALPSHPNEEPFLDFLLEKRLSTLQTYCF